ncbi:MAG: flagellar hook-length control protein FliK, partial [Candidatus Berkiella sp.]
AGINQVADISSNNLQVHNAELDDEINELDPIQGIVCLPIGQSLPQEAKIEVSATPFSIVLQEQNDNYNQSENLRLATLLQQDESFSINSNFEQTEERVIAKTTNTESDFIDKSLFEVNHNSKVVNDHIATKLYNETQPDKLVNPANLNAEFVSLERPVVFEPFDLSLRQNYSVPDKPTKSVVEESKLTELEQEQPDLIPTQDNVDYQKVNVAQKISGQFESLIQNKQQADIDQIITLKTSDKPEELNSQLDTSSEQIQISVNQQVSKKAEPTITSNNNNIIQRESIDSDLSEKIQLMINASEKSAQFDISPKELGKIEIKIVQDADKTHITFLTTHQEAQELIESSIERLKTQIQMQGLDLGNVTVSHQESQAHRQPLKQQAVYYQESTIGIDNTEVVLSPKTSSSMLDIYV